MRPIGIRPILVFICYLALVSYATWITSTVLEGLGGKNLLFVFVIFYIFAVLFYRLWIKFFNFKEGFIQKGSKDEFRYQVYAAINIFVFHPWLMSSVLPPPFATALYSFLGLKAGKATYISGIICDPHLVEIGANSFTGARSILVPHVMEDDFLAHHRIKIGNHVTIGTGATVLPGVEIEDYAIIGAQSLIRKNTKIGKNEIWGGIPARKIGMRSV